MLATLTSKGQLTLPRAIREQFQLGAGSRLDFSVDAAGVITARPVAATALGLAGLLRQAGRKPASQQHIDAAIEATAATLNPLNPARKAGATGTRSASHTGTDPGTGTRSHTATGQRKPVAR